jgi:hypothetical protein
MTKSFCVFIISHGRPDKVVTIRTLEKCGYTGPLFIVCDNEDKTLEQYRKNYGTDKVLVFDKLHYASLVDSCDNFQNRRTTTHARNACFDLAKERGFEFFLVLDDDYMSFCFTHDSSGKFKHSPIKNLDKVVAVFPEWMETDDRILSVCFLQGGDLIGGGKNTAIANNLFPFQKRKAMNSFFCKTSRRFWFFSRLNEDVNTYFSGGMRGALFFSIPDIKLNQAQTQATAGGMSEAYLASGTYVKSFYTVMLHPAFANVTFQRSVGRLHHGINWNNAVPKILDDVHKK